MIYSISGIITELFESSVLIKSGGLEWEVSVSQKTQEDLEKKKDKEVRLFTWLSISEHGASFYGFSTAEERVLFLSLIKVERIGPRGALKILSHGTAQTLGSMIQNKDVDSLSRISGVGRKTAQKILMNLEDLPFKIEEAPKEKLKNDLVLSLVQMGYTKTKVEEACVHLLEKKEIVLEETQISQTMKSIIQYLRESEHE